jgi:hypothetical protein
MDLSIITTIPSRRGSLEVPLTDCIESVVENGHREKESPRPRFYLDGGDHIVNLTVDRTRMYVYHFSAIAGTPKPSQRSSCLNSLITLLSFAVHLNRLLML